MIPVFNYTDHPTNEGAPLSKSLTKSKMALLLSSSCTESKACHHDASIFPGDKPKWYFTKLDHLAYSRWVSKDESRVKKQKVDNAGSEIQIECQQSIKKYS